jgi:hypothetical protein
MDERRLNFFLALQKKVEESKNLSPKAKEKFYALAEGSIGKPDEVEDLWDDGGDLARKFKETGFVPIDLGELTISVSDKKKKFEAESALDLNRHRPIETSKFLQEFSSNANPLKFLIHIKTDGFILEEIRKNWKQELDEYWESNIKKELRIRTYYFSGGKGKQGENKGWYSLNESKYYKFSYSDEQVEEWCANNPNAHPILQFENEIVNFKQSIKFFDGNLEERIRSAAASGLGGLFSSCEIEYQNLDKAEFYADTDAFLSGLKNVFHSVKQRISNSNKIKIIFEGKSTLQGRLRIIRVIHLKSDCDKELDKINLFGSDNGGDLKEAEKKFYQVCDWSIVAKYKDHGYRLNILYDISNAISPKEKVAPEEIEGFTHVFTFYS